MTRISIGTLLQTQQLLGYAGSRGDLGYTGSTGSIGYTGSQGVQGTQGEIGYTGSQAISSTSLRLISLVQPGTITVPYTGVARFYPVANLTISNVYASLGTASTTNFSFVIQKNDSNINTYTINANAFTMSATSANIVVNTTDYLTIDISAGSGATDLRVDLEYNYQ